jgi:hypothetical protein
MERPRRQRQGFVASASFCFSERIPLRVAAENVPGTREVKDHLVSVEPISGMVFEAPGQEREPIAKPG